MEEQMKQKKSLSDERLYTPEELENIIEARLSRERKNNDSLIKVREALVAIRKEESFKKLSNAQLAKKLSEMAENLSEDKTSADKDEPAVPDASAQGDNGGKDEKNADERREREIAEFISLYGERRLKELTGDRNFKSFCRRREGDLVTLYEDYCIFLGGLNATGRNAKAAQRGLASTGFSGYAAGTPDHASLLTENQKAIAASAGMSYKQYLELLSQIPTKKVGK